MKHVMAGLAAIVFGFSLSTAVVAQDRVPLLTADQMLENLGNEKQAPLAQVILHVVSLSLSAANADLESKEQPKLYCVPIHLALTPEQNRGIFEDYLARSPEMGEFPYFMIMLSALQDTFPCE
ncbi:hypothetical protein [Qipengyuania sp. 902]|uniref:hypothetical protein n=1 Tax=Qipengyuania sp. 902 TaxID=3417565 RepID=UPI003EBE5B29